MTERWATPADLDAARARLEAALGWERPPAAWGLLGAEGDVLKATVAGARLSAAAVATAVGAGGADCGTGAWPLGPAELDAAIAALEPAEACTEVSHPNLAALRVLRSVGGGVAVFVADERTLVTDPDEPALAALLAEIRRGRTENPDGTTTLWRPTGPEELALVRAAGSRAWPPRLPDQPIFYPVLTEDYAAAIARDWNVANSGVGHVTRFRLRTEVARRYPTQVAGGADRLELWIPAADLPEVNAAIVGEIELVAEFGG